MPSESDAATVPVVEAKVEAGCCWRVAVDVEKVIDSQLAKGRDVKIAPDGMIYIMSTKLREQRRSLQSMRRASAADNWRREPVASVKNSRQRRDETRNTRERYEERVLKRLEKARAERQIATAAIVDAASVAADAAEQASPMAEAADAAMGQATPERRGVRDVGAREGKRRVVTCETADAIERKAATVEMVAVKATTVSKTTIYTKYMYKSKGIERNKSKGKATSYTSVAYMALTRGERCT